MRLFVYGLLLSLLCFGVGKEERFDEFCFFRMDNLFLFLFLFLFFDVFFFFTCKTKQKIRVLQGFINPRESYFPRPLWASIM